jgi:hypothetical protein
MKTMMQPTKFPIEFLYKIMYKENKALKEENKSLREKNFEYSLRIQEFTCKHEAKIQAEKEKRYKDLTSQVKGYQKKYEALLKKIKELEQLTSNSTENDN